MTVMDASEKPIRYTVDRLSDVTVQIRQFIDRAKQLGIGNEIVDALTAIVDKLETTPLEWDDPQYATKKGGGLVLRGILFPFIVQYVTFEQQRVVCILKIRCFPQHPLDQ
jgi:hypothetical protein